MGLDKIKMLKMLEAEKAKEPAVPLLPAAPAPKSAEQIRTEGLAAALEALQEGITTEIPLAIETDSPGWWTKYFGRLSPEEAQRQIESMSADMPINTAIQLEYQKAGLPPPPLPFGVRERMRPFRGGAYAAAELGVKRDAAKQVISTMMDIEERPRYIAENLAYTIRAKPIKRLGEVREVPSWEDIKGAVVDGYRGKQYGTVMDIVKRNMLTDEEVATYNNFLSRHRGIRIADKVGDITTEFASAVAFEYMMYGGIRAGAKRVPGLKGLFDNVPKHVLKDGFAEAIEYKARGAMSMRNFLEVLQTNPQTLSPDWSAFSDTLRPRMQKEYIRVVTEAAEGAKPIVVPGTVRTMVDNLTFGKVKTSNRTIANILDDLTETAVQVMRPTIQSEELAQKFDEVIDLLPREIKERLDIKGITEGEFRGLAEGAGGRYDPRVRRIYLELGEEEADTLMHEVLHSYISDLDKGDLPFVEDWIRARFKPELAAKHIEDARKASNPAAYSYFSQENITNDLTAYFSGKLKDESKLQVLDKYFKPAIRKEGAGNALLDALVEDIATDVRAPKTVGFLTQAGADWGGIPSWKVFENLGLSRAYDYVDYAMGNMTILNIERRKWMKDAMKNAESFLGRKWDDNIDEIVARFADEGPLAKIPKALKDDLARGIPTDPTKLHKMFRGRVIKPGEPTVPPAYFVEWFREQLLKDRLDYLSEIAETDSALHWRPLADLAESQGLIGPGTAIPRQEYYYHWRKKFIDAMKERAGKEELRVLPADYQIDKAMKQKIPAGVNVPEFIARTGERVGIRYDWRSVTSMAYREELRKLYFEPAAKEFKAIVEGLPESELKRTAIDYSNDWMRYVRGMPSKWDDRFNRLVSKGIETITLNRVHVRQRAFEQFSQRMRRLIFTGTIGGNPRSITKNMTQSLLTVNTIGHRATVAGWESMFTPGGRRMLNQYRVMVGGRRLAMAEFNVASLRGWERLASGGFSAVDKYMNCAGAGNGAIYYLFQRSKKHMDELTEYAVKKYGGVGKGALKGKRFWDTVADAVDDGHFKGLVELANRNIKYTQYSYMPWDMPRHLWSQTGKTAFMFTSWPSNFFGAHLPQLYKQLVSGENVFGMAVTPAQRIALLTYITKGAFIFGLGRKFGYDMKHLLATGPMPAGRIHGYLNVPFPVSPPVEAATALVSVGAGGAQILMEALGQMSLGAAIDDNSLFKNGLVGLKNVYPAFIPVGTTARQVIRVAKKKAPFEAIFLPKRPKKKLKWPGGIGWPEK